MRHGVLLALLFAMGAALAGCFESEETITLNPDGSGKIELDVGIPVSALRFAEEERRDGNEAPLDPNQRARDVAKEAAVRMIFQSKGVDVWSDVKHGEIVEGRVRVTGTAYFPNYSTLRMNAFGPKPGTCVTDGNSMVLELPIDVQEERETVIAVPQKPEALTGQQIAETLKKERLEWEAGRKEGWAQMFGPMKVDVSFILPGKVTEANVFERTNKGVRLFIDGKKVVEAMDKVMADEKVMKEVVRSQVKPLLGGPGAEAIRVRIYGEKGPARARVTDLKPVFDYKAEVAKAKAAQPEWIKKISARAAEAD